MPPVHESSRPDVTPKDQHAQSSNCCPLVASTESRVWWPGADAHRRPTLAPQASLAHTAPLRAPSGSRAARHEHLRRDADFRVQHADGRRVAQVRSLSERFTPRRPSRARLTNQPPAHSTTLQPGNYLAVDLSSSNPDPPHASVRDQPKRRSPPRFPSRARRSARSTSRSAARASSTTASSSRFQNSGFLVHPIQGIGVKNANTARRLTALLRAANDKQAPKLGISFPEFAGPLFSGRRPAGADQLSDPAYTSSPASCAPRTAANRPNSEWNARSGSSSNPLATRCCLATGTDATLELSTAFTPRADAGSTAIRHPLFAAARTPRTTTDRPTTRGRAPTERGAGFASTTRPRPRRRCRCWLEGVKQQRPVNSRWEPRRLSRGS